MDIYGPQLLRNPLALLLVCWSSVLLALANWSNLSPGPAFYRDQLVWPVLAASGVTGYLRSDRRAELRAAAGPKRHKFETHIRFQSRRGAIARSLGGEALAA